MQPELLSVPQSEKTEEAFKIRLQRLYRQFGQDWRPVFEQMDKRLLENKEAERLPWWVIRRARQMNTPSGR